MIFYRKGVRKQDKKGNDIMYDLDKKINAAVFPGLQVCPLPPSSRPQSLQQLCYGFLSHGLGCYPSITLLISVCGPILWSGRAV